MVSRAIHPFPRYPKPAWESRLSIRPFFCQCVFRRRRRTRTTKRFRCFFSQNKQTRLECNISLFGKDSRLFLATSFFPTYLGCGKKYCVSNTIFCEPKSCENGTNKNMLSPFRKCASVPKQHVCLFLRARHLKRLY